MLNIIKAKKCIFSLRMSLKVQLSNIYMYIYTYIYLFSTYDNYKDHSVKSENFQYKARGTYPLYFKS